MKNGFKLRNLSIAALVGLAGFGATNSAQANETPITPTLGDDASYTLKEVSTPTDNSITLYKYDNTGITEAINYEINLKQTEYGTGVNSKDFTVSVLGEDLLIKTNYDSSLSRVDSTNIQPIILGDFVEKYTSGTSSAYGGAIYNTKNIQKIDANFYGNYVKRIKTNTSGGNLYGGAIYNDRGSIDLITGDFIGNHWEADTSVRRSGAAIYNNYGNIGDITGDFIANYSSLDNSAEGGAIYNNAGVIGDITGDFIGNIGGAIYNYGDGAIIGNLTGDYISNYNDYHSGGAIYSTTNSISQNTNLSIGDITGDFIGNFSYSDSYYNNFTNGGAIYNGNCSHIGNITGNYIGNYAHSYAQNGDKRTYSSGGAIANSGYSDYANPASIGIISANFIGNYALSSLNPNQEKGLYEDEFIALGGAIYNDSRIGAYNVSNDKIIELYEASETYTNSQTGESVTVYYTYGEDWLKEKVAEGYKFKVIEPDSVSQVVPNEYWNDCIVELAENVESGYLSYNPVLDNELKVLSDEDMAQWKGIYNSTFIGNYVKAESFYHRNADSDYAILNLLLSKGEFINEETGEKTTLYMLIDEDNNTVSLSDLLSSDKFNQGYRLKLEEDSQEIILTNDEYSNFLNVFQEGIDDGSVALNSPIDQMEDWWFYKETKDNNAFGGAIYNESVIALDIDSSTFVANKSSGYGGAIANVHENKIYSHNGSHTLDETLNIKNSVFIGNEAEFLGGAIYDSVDLQAELSSGSLINPEKYSISTFEASEPVYDVLTLSIGTNVNIENSLFKNNRAKLGGAIAAVYDVTLYSDMPVEEDSLISTYESEPMDSVQANPDNIEFKMQISDSVFDSNIATKGGAIYFDRSKIIYENSMPEYPCSLGLDDVDEKVNISNSITEDTIYNLTIKNTSFINNVAFSDEEDAQGGAIYTNANTKIIADGVDSVFAENKIYTDTSEVLNDIYVVSNSTEMYFNTSEDSISNNFKPVILSLEAVNNGTITFGGTIDGEVTKTLITESYYGDLVTSAVESVDSDIAYTLDITGDGSGRVIFGNAVKKANISISDTFVQLAKDTNFDNDNLTLNSGTLSMINNQVGVSALSNMTVVGDTNVLVDVDLKNQTMDRFTASEYGSHSGNLNVTGMNLLSDAVNDTTEIMFAEQGLKDNVTNGITSQLPDDKYQTTLFTPIYKYNVSYDNREDAGYFVFSRGASGGSSGGSADSFNPAVLGSSTAASVGATATMNNAFNYAFQHSADHMNIPYLERISMRDRNKYALSVTGDATDMGRFSPLYLPSQEEASVWVKPYATFETVGLKNGPKVHNNTYGTLIGFDTQMQSLRRGWDRVFTGYIGYNGASQRYSGIDSTQNGGLLGGTMTLYKGNFFNATTVSVGASVANNQTMYGNEDFAMLLSGIGNKTGYNFEFKEGKLILQPSMLMSYTFVNTFDYTNAAGVRIDNKPLHALQLAPGVKVIGNLKGGWQPYASVQMVWNLMGESNATANGVKLPEMSIKPYVQYGVGVQKRIKDHFTAYGQAMVQNGGRNGVSLTAGFRWALGHDNCKYEKTQRHPEVKTEGSLTSKETLRSAQNDGSRKILKQMTPQQRAAYGGKYYNTSRTAKTGSLRQY